MSWKKLFSCVFLSSLLITYLINSCFLQKSLDEVLCFGSNLYEPCMPDTDTKCIWYSMDTSPISDSPFIGIGAARRGAVSLRYRNRPEITVPICEQKPYPIERFSCDLEKWFR